ncbi:unnamed protein product [Closterium sp. NIES-53]
MVKWLPSGYHFQPVVTGEAAGKAQVSPSSFPPFPSHSRFPLALPLPFPFPFPQTQPLPLCHHKLARRREGVAAGNFFPSHCPFPPQIPPPPFPPCPSPSPRPKCRRYATTSWQDAVGGGSSGGGGAGAGGEGAGAAAGGGGGSGGGGGGRGNRGGTRKGVYHCNYCHRDVTGEVRVKCAACVDFDLCAECFSVGAAAHPHSASHPYHVMDTMSFPLVREDWTADEEMLLLEVSHTALLAVTVLPL